MRLFVTGSVNPYFNLAVEEYFFKYSDDDIFMLWQNEPSVIIGKNQNMYAEVDVPYTEEQGIHIARRITGGGAVYHDLQNINFTFITSREKAAVLDYAYFTRPIVEALANLGLKARLSGRNDLLVTVGDDEFKFSGNAETADEKRILHHGTILFNSDLSVLVKALKPDEDKLKRKGIKSVRSRVTNLKPLIEKATGKTWETRDLLEYLLAFVEKEAHCTRETVDPAAIQSTGLPERNASEDYNAGRKKTYAHRAKRVSDAGIILALWNEENGIVTDFAFEGDFFGEKSADELSQKLIGHSIDEVRKTCGIGTYIAGTDDLSWLKDENSNGTAFY